MKVTTKQGERFNLLNDFLFFKVMGEKGDEEQLLSFLNAVLGTTGDDRFSSVEILENRTLTAEEIGNKTSILDVRAILQGKTKVNVEVQLRNYHNMDKRSLFYWSREFARSLGAGQDYHELPRVIAINIIDFTLFPDCDFHTCFHLWEDKVRTLLTDALEIHCLDMVKWRRLDNKDLVNNPLHRWLTWFDPCSPPELVAEVIGMDNAILKADERQDHILSDEDALRLYEMRQKSHWDYLSGTNYARREGHEEGREERSMEIAIKMKSHGLSIIEIAKFTGLTPEEIEKL